MTPGAATRESPSSSNEAPKSPHVIEALKRSPAPLVVVDRNVRVLDTNDYGKTRLDVSEGASLADALGVKAGDLAPLFGGLAAPLELAGRTRAGSARLVLVPVPLPDAAHIAVFVHPLPTEDGARPTAPEGAAGVTAREREVLTLLATGKSTVAIAKELGIARTTARNHIQAIIGKLDAHSRLEAVAKARDLGLV